MKRRNYRRAHRAAKQAASKVTRATSEAASQLARRTSRAGAPLEDFLERQCGYIRDADVTRRSNPLRVVGRANDGRLLCVNTTSESVDFEGVVSGGRFVGFDAKTTTSGTSWSIGDRTISTAQIDRLARRAALGAISFVYLRAGDGHDYILPVLADGSIGHVWHRRCKGNNARGFVERQSVNYQDSARFRVRRGEAWIAAMRRLIEAGAWYGDTTEHQTVSDMLRERNT